MNEIASCRICNYSDLKLLWKLKPCAYGDLFKETYQESLLVQQQPIELSRCKKCGLVQLLRQTDIQGQYDNYIYQTSVTKGLNQFYSGVVKRILADYPEIRTNSGYVIDIGSNDGSFLQLFKEIGIPILGVEPSESASLAANEKGIETLREYFNLEISKKILMKYGRPGLISLNYTLANIPDLKNLFSNLLNIMNDKTIVSVITGYHPDQFAVNMFDYIGHDHLTYLSLNDFVNLATEFDLNILDANRYEHKGGSLHVTLALKTSSYSSVISPNVHQLLQREKWMGIDKNHFYRDLELRIVDAANNLNNFFEKNNIESVPAVGASISTTYLMNQFNLGSRVTRLYDDDKLKQGKFSPHFGKQVFPLTDISQGEFSHILLLAWQHTERIIERLRHLRFSGKLIVPLPELQVLDFQSDKF